MTTSPTMNLRDAVTFHQLTLASEGRTEKTQRHYRHFQQVFLRYLDNCGTAPDLEALNPANMGDALAWYHTQSDFRRSRGGVVAGMVFVDTMKLWANFLEREGLFTDSPLRKVRRVKVAKQLRQPFTQTELVAMWGACHSSPMPTRNEALFLLLLDTGMRIGEACTLTLDHVKLDQRQIIIGTEGKGRRERLVPIGQRDKRDGGRTVRALRAYIARRPESNGGRDRVFLGRDGYPLEAAGGSEAISRLGKLAGVADAGPHRCRHSFATWYLTMYAGDEEGLRRIIGHVSNEVLADYVHFSQTTLADRAGRASLSETLGMVASALQRPAMPAPVQRSQDAPIALAWGRPASPVPRSSIDQEALVEAVKHDPELRKALLQALIGAA